MLAGAGMLAWLAGSAPALEGAEWLVSGGGALVVFGALLWNAALRARCCACAACGGTR